APWRHHDAMAEGRASVLMQAALGRGKHEGAGLDGTGARQHMPMGFSGLLREGSGDGDKLCAGRGERAIERREAEVITDAEPESAEGQVGEHRLGAGAEILRLAVALAPGKVDVEHMQLVIARRDPTLWIEQVGAISDASLIELDGDGADMQPNAKIARERPSP